MGVHEDVLYLFVKVDVERASGVRLGEIELLLFGNGLDVVWFGFGGEGFADDFVDWDAFASVEGRGNGGRSDVVAFRVEGEVERVHLG